MKRARFIAIVALLLIVCVSLSTPWNDQYKTQALSGDFTVIAPSLTPTPTPAPTPTPTATPAPTLTPTASPTSTPNSGGDWEQPDPEYKLRINLVGKATEWLQSKDGTVLEYIATSSRDERVTVYASIGTTILGTHEEPINHIFAGVVDPFTKSPPSDILDKCYFVNIYEFLPEGTKFSTPLNIQLAYEESDIPGNIDETTLKLFQFNPDTGEWTFIPSTTNPDVNTVTFSTNHFSIYALIASPLPNSQNTPTPHALPKPTTNTTNHDFGIWIITILIAECLILNIMLLVYWRNKKRYSHN